MYVLVVTGLRPDEAIGPYLPTLRSLAARGTSFAAARAVPVAATVPNLVATMTGVHPERSGVPADVVFDPERGAVRELALATDLRAPTLLERLPAELGLSSSTVLAKECPHGVFGSRATYRWGPEPVLPVTRHASDAVTMGAVLAEIDAHDPALLFANLADLDRFGHADLGGGSPRLLRTLALVDTDTQLARFTGHLRRTGRWRSSVVVVLADHSTDWSLPLPPVELAERLAADPLLAGNTVVARNGGAALLYWTGGEDDRPAALARMRERARATPGVSSVHEPGSLRLGPLAGDLVVHCAAGRRFGDLAPGNHGHPVTEPIPLVVSGGHPVVRRGRVFAEPVRSLDVAPTVAALFGLPAPEEGWDGRALLNAFAREPAALEPVG
ncbi:alkaline phosphatase family protein [Actinophytocola xanthii]|uniref:Alkaline phosphatase family protein n=1 Tax=Actinophytocola xanthii TaxID=1912961 RepID=A0A1Q8CG55_9PSEU|nr:alkaline phosphatase family protein [Actinophytocola xanthii]